MLSAIDPAKTSKKTNKKIIKKKVPGQAESYFEKVNKTRTAYKGIIYYLWVNEKKQTNKANKYEKKLISDFN